MGLLSETVKVERLKRELLRQAVQENLDLIAGRGPTLVRRQARRRWALRLGLAAIAVPAGVLASTFPWNGQVGAGPGDEAARSDVISAMATPAAEGPAPPPAAAAGGVTAAATAPAVMPSSPHAAWEAIPPSLDHAVFPLAVRKVVLDPGHGGASLGTRTPSGLAEKHVTLDIADRLRRLLAERGLEVVLTREDDVAVPLEERARLANQASADLFVSIHVNWIDGGSRGVETYYLGPTDDPFVSRLAAAENRESGYAMADMRLLLDRILSGVRASQSRELAQEIQSALHRSLSKLNPQLQDRGVKTAPFLVLVETGMPAILAEVSCLSNEREAELLGKPLYRQYIAEAMARGIAAYADAGSTAGGSTGAGTASASSAQ
jgi:N-acetylmuramoyl-L-alanine amidase